jgi:FG-GAP-like repeat
VSQLRYRYFVPAMTWLICLLPALATAQISFAPSQNYPLRATPFRVVAGDLNSDGNPDLAVLSINGGTVSTLLNHGDGTFAPPRDFPALTPDPAGATYFSGITLGDVNVDQKVDVILTHTTDVNTGTGVINVLLGNGDGTFQSPISTPVNSFAYRLVGVGDFNADGRLDVACIADDPTNTVVSLVMFLGNGDGTFVRVSSFQPASSYPGVALADVNHDDKLDVVIPGATNLSGNQVVTVLLGNGDGTFQAPLSVAVPTPADGLSVGDFDHDGKPDLVTTSYQYVQCTGDFPPLHCVNVGPPGAATLLRGNGDGTWKAPGSTFNGDYFVSVLGDFDGDGNLDLAAAQGSGGQSGFNGWFDFFLGDGSGGFSSPASINQLVANLLTADLDGDGFTDLVLPSSSSLQVALNNSSTFVLTSVPGPAIPPGGTAAYTITVAQQHGQGAMATLRCSVPAGVGIACSVSPSSVASGATATLNVTTMGPSAGLVLPTSRQHQPLLYALWLPVGAVLLGGIGFASHPSRTKKLLVVILGCVLGAGLLFQVACGGGINPPPKRGTPPGTYTITVTGTAGTISRSTNVSLTVQ